MSRIKENKFATLDCETDPFQIGQVPEPFIWGFYDGEQYEIFRKTEEMIDFVSKFNGDVYAHNGGKFDFHFILEHFNPSQKILLINGRISKVKMGKATLKDSYNILPVPLSKMMKDEIDYGKMHRDVREEHMDEIIKYLYGDVRYLWEYVKQFIDRYGTHLTLAGAAFNQWKELGHKRPTQRKADFDLFRQYYFGGRVEVFKKGIHEGPVYISDINSAYPYVMRSLYHPIGTDYYNTCFLRDKFIDKCFVTLECRSHGAFPFRIIDGPRKGGIEFPDRFDTYHITGHEFKTAKELNLISNEKIKNVFVMNELIKFDDYIDKFFEEKKQAKRDNDPVAYLFAKLFMNSLYGKFASDYSKYKEYNLMALGDKIDMDQCIEYENQFYSLVSNPLNTTSYKFLNICTSASITGAVRAFLLKNLHACPDRLYCDTDSIITTSKPALNFGEEIGQWDLEMTGTRGAFCGKKLYAVQKEDGSYKARSKGAHLNGEEIFRVANGETVLWENEAPTFSMKEGARFLSREIKLTI